MACGCYEASAPGKLMLLGEHAVLHGRLAVVCAVGRRVYAVLRPRQDKEIHMTSALGAWSGTAADLPRSGPLRFVAAALAMRPLPAGLDLSIRAEFSATLGLGSSAATTAAVCAAVAHWRGDDTRPAALFGQALAAVRNAQGGRGSGADVAASVYGGVLAYRGAPLEIIPLQAELPLTVVYSGAKTPTLEVIARVDDWRRRNPVLAEQIFDAMETISREAVTPLKQTDLQRLGELFAAAHGLLAALGVSTPALNRIVDELTARPGVFGAKLSGAGLGDCVVAVGRTDTEGVAGTPVPLTITAKGANCVAREG